MLRQGHQLAPSYIVGGKCPIETVLGICRASRVASGHHGPVARLDRGLKPGSARSPRLANQTELHGVQYWMRAVGDAQKLR
jgi:hypothetical protein